MGTFGSGASPNDSLAALWNTATARASMAFRSSVNFAFSASSSNGISICTWRSPTPGNQLVWMCARPYSCGAASYQSRSSFSRRRLSCQMRSISGITAALNSVSASLSWHINDAVVDQYARLLQPTLMMEICGSPKKTY